VTAVFALGAGLAAAGLPEDAIQLVPTRDRAAVGIMLTMSDWVDVIVPRGGKSLIERVQRESRIPVIAHLEGRSHTYIDGAADPARARSTVCNAKMRRVSVCGATETLLVDRAAAGAILPPILGDLRAAGCELRGDAATRALDPAVLLAAEADWHTRLSLLRGLLAVVAEEEPLGEREGALIVAPPSAHGTPWARKCGPLSTGFALDSTPAPRRVALLPGPVLACRLTAGPMQQAMDWLNHYQRFWSENLDRLAAFLEEDQWPSNQTLPAPPVSSTDQASPSNVVSMRRPRKSTRRGPTRKK